MARFFAGVMRVRLPITEVATGGLVIGSVQPRSAPVGILPEFSPPYAEVQTEALALYERGLSSKRHIGISGA
jgi:hypothetical protein